MKKLIIVDIDGTIAEIPEERLEILNSKPIDWDKFHEASYDDDPVPNVLELVQDLSGSPDYELIFCTGRNECIRNKTQDWLDKWHLFGPLIMRPLTDYRPDYEVKPEMLKKYLLTRKMNFSDIAFCLEDRNQVTAAWRDHGLTCLQVREGDY